MSRISHEPDPDSWTDEDRHVLALLAGPFRRPTHQAMLARVAHPEREADPRERIGPSSAFLSPLCQAALSMVGTATMRGQSKRFSPEAHWWGDLVIGFELSQAGGERWHMLAQNVACAVSAGIRVEAIEALRRDDLEAMTSEERQYVTFVRAVVAGTVDDECWRRQVDLVGSERGVVELAVLYLYLALLVRLGQTLGLEPDVDAAQLDEMLDGLRAGTWPLIDVGEYTKAFEQDMFQRIPVD